MNSERVPFLTLGTLLGGPTGHSSGDHEKDCRFALERAIASYTVSAEEQHRLVELMDSCQGSQATAQIQARMPIIVQDTHDFVKWLHHSLLRVFQPDEHGLERTHLNTGMAEQTGRERMEDGADSPIGEVDGNLHASNQQAIRFGNVATETGSDSHCQAVGQSHNISKHGSNFQETEQAWLISDRRNLQRKGNITSHSFKIAVIGISLNNKITEKQYIRSLGKGNPALENVHMLHFSGKKKRGQSSNDDDNKNRRLNLKFKDRNHANHCLEHGITLKRKTYKCEIVKPKPDLKCGQCQGLGHQTCDATPICGSCAGQHSTKECENAIIRCANCNGNHLTKSKECQVRQEWMREAGVRFPTPDKYISHGEVMSAINGAPASVASSMPAPQPSNTMTAQSSSRVAFKRSNAYPLARREFSDEMLGSVNEEALDALVRDKEDSANEYDPDEMLREIDAVRLPVLTHIGSISNPAHASRKRCYDDYTMSGALRASAKERKSYE
ncbi:uncharacterized protein KY384_008931 [Bacidia gigantensis]|uniref:uncharacterized protein n=1 Tax=Bacidia gigantensis TaxID=2732470 RepID=UPI001D03F886|nr:uncharacterized protein KY384_008931 [Bacidia gigantensis]KAG8525287.1 hypothetical protein KY384_008931 [Bacidia gigantensis]